MRYVCILLLFIPSSDFHGDMLTQTYTCTCTHTYTQHIHLTRTLNTYTYTHICGAGEAKVCRGKGSAKLIVVMGEGTGTRATLTSTCILHVDSCTDIHASVDKQVHSNRPSIHPVTHILTHPTRVADVDAGRWHRARRRRSLLHAQQKEAIAALRLRLVTTPTQSRPPRHTLPTVNAFTVFIGRCVNGVAHPLTFVVSIIRIACIF